MVGRDNNSFYLIEHHRISELFTRTQYVPFYKEIIPTKTKLEFQRKFFHHRQSLESVKKSLDKLLALMVNLPNFKSFIRNWKHFGLQQAWGYFLVLLRGDDIINS